MAVFLDNYIKLSAINMRPKMQIFALYMVIYDYDLSWHLHQRQLQFFAGDSALHTKWSVLVEQQWTTQCVHNITKTDMNWDKKHSHVDIVLRQFHLPTTHTHHILTSSLLAKYLTEYLIKYSSTSTHTTGTTADRLPSCQATTSAHTRLINSTQSRHSLFYISSTYIAHVIQYVQ